MSGPPPGHRDGSTYASRIPATVRHAFVLGAVLLAATARAQTEYPLTADSERLSGVPAGKVTRHAWSSAVFPGTQRDYWLYVPAQYRPDAPAAVMVFQDGGRFVAADGRWRVPVVFDNLIHRGEMPVTIGVFVDPGVVPARGADEQPRFNRSFEYDGLGDRYARFLLEELLPEVGKSFRLTDDPSLRAIGGSSSGGICAFTVAWNRPDALRRFLPDAHPQDRAAPDPGVPPGREPRPGHLQRQLVDREPGDGERARVRGLRRPLRSGRSGPRQRPGLRDPARRAAVAVALLEGAGHGVEGPFRF